MKEVMLRKNFRLNEYDQKGIGCISMCKNIIPKVTKIGPLNVIWIRFMQTKQAIKHLAGNLFVIRSLQHL